MPGAISFTTNSLRLNPFRYRTLADKSKPKALFFNNLRTNIGGGDIAKYAQSSEILWIRPKLVYTQKVVQSSTSLGNSMPKLKTHSGAAKRFKKTGTGKFKRGQSKMRHILTSKATKTKKKLGRIVLVSEADTAKVARMLPYA